MYRLSKKSSTSSQIRSRSFAAITYDRHPIRASWYGYNRPFSEKQLRASICSSNMQLQHEVSRSISSALNPGLIDLISRVGVPTEIITDQGTNFMSKLMKTLYRQLGITGITGVRTTPYHLQNGRAFYWYA